ncbi:ABC-F family ATP-binding cassette domain-containing protein [Roseburia hominis]|uniref:ABC transporter ATP-binding protein n=1 Tax=Roseburia hominis TaxID=301301 RepID=A0A395VC00_9FIRM|nr:ABC-F family ATP-binding cassette domain-containing protein [Roseburia hominis]RGS42088.1 ABC transporter ATP-binding protein [Roseburia hominis]
MILSCQNISKSFGTDEILKNVSFHIEANEKAAIVGINGAGKSTLLKIIMQKETPDTGEVILAKDATIGYLAQYQDVSGHRTIYEEVLDAKKNIIEMEERLRGMEAQMNALTGQELEALLDGYHRLSHEFELLGGYTYRSEVTGILKGLGFAESEFDRQMSELSGGQKTRVSLGKLLVTKPDVLLLDEPTNHLDMESIQWLEGFLMNYKGAVVIVSHDRYFLDRVVTKVVEIFQHQGYVYQGNYTEFAKKKAKIREDLLKQYYNQQREIKHQEEVIAKLKSFNREKSIKRAESREKMLDKIERLEKPTDENTDIHIVLAPDVTSGNDVLTVEHLRKAFGAHTLFTDLSFEIKRGERVALTGNNGTGKTTILKIINELIPADGGTIVLGSNVHIGYYDQEHQLLHMEKTIFEEIADDYPQLNHTKIRNVLAAFLFTNDDVFKRIADLSGGERGRVSLAKLMLSDANFLILDEPTNHLDITSKEILESALNQYTGTVFFVSHDRYFINQTATRILDLTGGTIVNYIGNYDYYLEKHDELTRIYVEAEPKAQAAQMTEQTVAQDGSGTDKKADWQAQKAEQARIRKLENTLKKAEERIAELEDLIAGIDEECADPANATNSAKLGELTGRQNEYRSELEKCYEEWEQVSMELES